MRKVKKVIKKSGKLVQAYCLGVENKKVKELMAEGLLEMDSGECFRRKRNRENWHSPGII